MNNPAKNVIMNPGAVYAPDHRRLKVALVHDWLVVYGGAERVLEHILDCYPQADLFSLIDHVPAEQRHFLRGKEPKTSFLQHLPGVAKHYRKLLPLMPLAIEQFDLSSYDLVLTSSYCVAKGVLSGPNQTHVSYCHSPMRYAWDHYHEYLQELNLQKGLKSWFVRWQLHNIRTWDVRSSNTVDHFVANSKFVQARIRKFYGRSSALLYPPIETGLFELRRDKEEFYAAAGRFVPFKRLDLVVDAFTAMPERRLVMIGDGPEMAKLRAKAGPNVEFVGFQPPEVVRDYLSRARAFIFPSEEDFGIVPVEAQACGTPVIAFGSGGALETVLPANDERAPEQSTGLWFGRQTAASLARAVLRFEALADRFDPEFISAHAASFSPDAFKRSLVAEVQTALDARLYVPERCQEEEEDEAAGTASLPRLIAPVLDTEAEPDEPCSLQRFGVPVTLPQCQDLAQLVPADQSPAVVTAVTWQQLREAGRNRDYQYALNDCDAVIPFDAATWEWLSPTRGHADDACPAAALIANALANRDVLILHDAAEAEHAAVPEAVAGLAAADVPVLALPSSETRTTLLLHRLKEKPVDVLLVVASDARAQEWIVQNRDRLPVSLILSVPAQRPPSAPSNLQLLRRLTERSAGAVNPVSWWRRLAWSARLKRTLDISVSALGLLLLSPLLLLTAALIRMESPGPVIFRQQRVGLRGRTFTMFKFRSMFIEAEAQLAALESENESNGGVLFKMRNDPRITRVGRFIRRLSIDELPQLFNVLRGDMTLVGPRPALPSEVAQYSYEARKRLQVKPGLTCLWQIGGRSDLSFSEQVELDLDYASRQGLAQDVSIILRTVPAVLRGTGAY